MNIVGTKPQRRRSKPETEPIPGFTMPTFRELVSDRRPTTDMGRCFFDHDLCVGANPYIGSRGVFDDRQALAGRPGRDLST